VLLRMKENDLRDRRVYDAIGELGDKLLPGYSYMIFFRIFTQYMAER
jgi:hypothetical protein